MNMINDNPVSSTTPNNRVLILLDSVFFVSQTWLVWFVEGFVVSLDISLVESLEMSVTKQLYLCYCVILT